MVRPESLDESDDGDVSLLTGADERFGFDRSGLPPAADMEFPPGTDLGGVTIERLIGAGGMGRVYAARQEAPRRTVAVKVMHARVPADRDAADERRRFADEAETLARLRHPHIAQIHTCGAAATPAGPVPFFVMELVEEGRPITRHAALRGLSVRQRVALLRQVCAAVAHGHGQGVVHRDLKPSNILVSGAGEPKVIDFGVARWAGAGGEDHVVGTLRYMSPEQLRGDAAGLDARGDVYALGLVLHELVTGALPHDLAGLSVSEAARIVADAAAPGTVAVERATVAETGRDDARALAVVVAKCLEPAAGDRYAHAGELEADLARWLDGRSILARPPTPAESLRRFARRHRVATVAGGVAASVLVAAAVAVAALSVQAHRQRLAAEESRAAAHAQATEARRQLYFSKVMLAAEARDRDNLAEARHLLADARGLSGADGGPEPIELACVAATLDEAIEVLPGHAGTVTAVGWATDGRTGVTGDETGTVRVWRAGAVGAPGRTCQSRAAHEDTVWAVAVSPDGTRVASAGADGTVRLHDAAFGTPVLTIGGVVVGATGASHSGAVYDVAFSSDGSTLVTAARDGTARLWDAATGDERVALRGHAGTVFAACLSPDDAVVATAGHDGTVRLWDAVTGHETAVLRGHTDRVFHVTFSPSGRLVASASEDGTARIWDVATDAEIARLRHPVRVNGVAFAGGDGLAVTAAGDGIVRIWNTATGAVVGRQRGHAGAVWAVAGLAGEPRVLTGSADGTARIWDASGGSAPVFEPAPRARVLSAAFAPNGRSLALGLDDARVAICDTATLEQRAELGPAIGRVNGIAFTPDSGRLVAACDDGVVFMWDVATGARLLSAQPHGRRVYAVGVSPDGRRLATASEDRTAKILAADSGEVAATLHHPRRVFCATFSVDGAVVATACEDRVARIWDAATGRELRRLDGHSGPVNWLAFSGDGSRLATASSDGSVRLWRVADGAEEAVLHGPARQVWRVAFAPDSSRVAAVSADGTAQLWDTATGRAALMLRGHDEQVWAVAFAPDGRSLVTGSWDGSARVWGVAPAGVVAARTAAGR
jgi:WD40 repeat protein